MLVICAEQDAIKLIQTMLVKHIHLESKLKKQDHQI